MIYFFSVCYVQAESDENDNDVILSPRDDENQAINTVDAVEIHVMDENGDEVERNFEEIEKVNTINSLDNKANQKDDNTLTEISESTVTSNESDPSLVNNQSQAHDKQNKHVKDVKSKSSTRKIKSKELKKPMQIFTVLEEEISDVSDIETPRS